jgi:hypothetical protein
VPATRSGTARYSPPLFPEAAGRPGSALSACFRASMTPRSRSVSLSLGPIDLGPSICTAHRRGRPQPRVEMSRRSTNESPDWLARGDSSRIDRVEMSNLAGRDRAPLGGRHPCHDGGRSTRRGNWNLGRAGDPRRAADAGGGLELRQGEGHRRGTDVTSPTLTARTRALSVLRQPSLWPRHLHDGPAQRAFHPHP